MILSRIALCALALGGVEGSSLQNQLVNASFDLSGRLVALWDRAHNVNHAFTGDGWSIDVGDLPFPTGADVQKDKQATISDDCPALNNPPALTSADQCAYHCMATDGCEAWSASRCTWVTWGRPRYNCQLSTCTELHDVDPSMEGSAGLKPGPPTTKVQASSCASVDVTVPSTSTLQALHHDCAGYTVNVTYELQPGWHFVTKHVALCKLKDGACDDAAGFGVRHVDVWPGLTLDKDLVLGAVALNPYNRHDLYKGASPKGSDQTATFWRSTAPQASAGLFASVQNSFLETGEGLSAFRWGSSGRWAGLNFGSWLLGAAITDDRNFQPAAVSGTLNIRGKTARGQSDAALMLESVLDLGAGSSSVEVTLVEGYYTNQDTPQPIEGGYAGIVFGAAATAATASASATLDGFAAVITVADGKQKARFVRLSGALEDATSTAEVVAEADLSVSSTAPLRLAVKANAQLGGTTSMLVDGAVVLEATLPALAKAAAERTAVGLIVLGQDASFANFTSTAVAASGPVLVPNSSRVHGFYSPWMVQAAELGAWHVADPGVLGVTQLLGYEFAETGVDFGEQEAFTACVEHFLMDKEMRKGGALRLMVAWDSNEYQLDMAKAEDREQYKRLISRNAQLGIKNMIYEPRNTMTATRWQHTDAWWWESVLWFQMGIGLRNGSWFPGRDPLPPTVSEMLDFFKSVGVDPVAYVYPTLAWQGEGQDEWLYESPDREAGEGKRASLASPKLQDYLIKAMGKFLEVTGGSGFAWDYGIQGDTRIVNLYQEVRGWNRILGALREQKPDLVMDHRQIAHNFNAWYHLPGSYSEPIAGDENPESYGAALASLSTDHILADNLRLTNYRYRLQMLPNDRIPGFMFHQTERHFNNGTGDDSAGKPGDKVDSAGNALWKPDDLPGPDGNYSGITYSNCVIEQDWLVRDFDYLGYRYSVLSTIGTAGRNLVVANIPARDLEENEHFPKEDVAWMRKWFDWADEQSAYLKRTRPLAHYEYPRLDHVDGTVATHNNSGFLFLYNPSPDGLSADVKLDATLGLSNEQGSWQVSELYPSESGIALGVWKWGDVVSLDVSGGACRVLELKLVSAPMLEKPIAFNVSYTSIEITPDGAVAISGAVGRTGSVADVVVRVPAAAAGAAGGAPTGVIINGQALPANAASHAACGQDACLRASLRFGGDASLRHNALAAPKPTARGGEYAADITVTAAMLQQLAERQAAYNITWSEQDLDATWLVPSRLLLYLYVARPTPSLATPLVTLDGKAINVTKQYNSRGNHAIVPAGGGAVSGDTARTFLGWYVDCTALEADSTHHVEITFPNWSDDDLDAHPFYGLYWQNVEDSVTNVVSGAA